MTRAILASLRRFCLSDSGTASIEFVFVIPVITMIFMASVESSFYMARHVMLERSLDVTMRELRLGMMGAPSHNALKVAICARGVILGSQTDCLASLKVWLQPLNGTTFAMPTLPASCVDRTAALNPALDPPPTEFDRGTGNQIMLVRVCLQEDPMFPTSPFGAQMVRDSVDGGYSVVSSSVFVNEPS